MMKNQKLDVRYMIREEEYLFYILKWGKQGEVLRQPYSDK